MAYKGCDYLFCNSSRRFINKQFRFDIYLGWKLSGTQEYTNEKRAMVAIRINPFLSVK